MAGRWRCLLMITLTVGAFATYGMSGAASARAASTPAELIGNWQLVTLQGAGAPAESTVGAGLTLAFQPDGSAGGSGGCNVFGATVTTDDQGRFKLDGLVSTLRACADGTRDEREKRYFANLLDARGYTLDGNTLRLNFDQAGRQLVFERSGSGGTPGMPNTGGGGLAASTPATALALLSTMVGLLGVSLMARRRERRSA